MYEKTLPPIRRGKGERGGDTTYDIKLKSKLKSQIENVQVEFPLN